MHNFYLNSDWVTIVVDFTRFFLVQKKNVKQGKLHMQSMALLLYCSRKKVSRKHSKMFLSSKH